MTHDVFENFTIMAIPHSNCHFTYRVIILLEVGNKEQRALVLVGAVEDAPLEEAEVRERRVPVGVLDG